MTSPLTRLLRTAPVALALVAGGLAACGDPLRSRANLSTVADTLVVYPLTDPDAARRDYPTALLTVGQSSSALGDLIVGPRVTSATGNGDFDVAFDINSAGKIVVLPQRRVVPGAPGRAVGLRTVGERFDDLREAPTEGFQFDSVAVALDPGQTLVIQAQAAACFNDYGNAAPYTFSKLVVDSVSAGDRAIFFRVVVDPNCGFRSFASGVPAR